MSEPLLPVLSKLTPRVRTASRVLLFSDFDGTLVPISPHPDDCVLSPGVAQTLADLAQIPHVRISIVSGRPLSDLRLRFSAIDVACAGNHGLEIEGPGFTFCEPTAEQRRELLDRLVGALRSVLNGIEGAWVEHKGLSASVHHRWVTPELVPQVHELVHTVAGAPVPDNPFVLRSGKAVLEVRPRVDWNKGHAVNWLVSRWSDPSEEPLTIYLGDDETDQDAFAALPQGLTIEVGPRPASQARYHVEDSTEVAQVLGWLRTTLTVG